MKKLTSTLLVLFALLAFCGSASSDEALPIYKCPKVSVAPTIDGKLDDKAWQKAPVAAHSLVTTGEAVPRGTNARICWDDMNLYVAFECDDSDIWGTLKGYDSPVYKEECVEVFIDPDRDLTRYLEICVSPLNTIFDADITNLDGLHVGPGSLPGWTCEGLKTAISIDGTLENRTDVDRGYNVEMAIPFASLGTKTPKPEQRWRANLYRIERLPGQLVEYQAWSPTLALPAQYHVPKQFGTLIFCDIQ